MALQTKDFDGSGIPQPVLKEKVIPLLRENGIKSIDQFPTELQKQKSLVNKGLALSHCEAIAKVKNEKRPWNSFTRKEIITDLGHLLNCTPSVSSKLRFLTFILFLVTCLISYQVLHSLRRNKNSSLLYKNSFATSLDSEFIVKAECENKNTHVQKQIKFVWSLGEENGETGENVKELKETSDQGVLCVRGSFGRLNNNVVEVKSALWFAFLTNRTLIVMGRVSGIYDVRKLQNVRPHADYKVALSYDSDKCKDGVYFKEGGNYKKNDDVLPGKLLTNRRTRYRELDKFISHTASMPVVHIAAAYLYYFQINDMGFERSFFTNLWPLERFQRKAEDFVNVTYGSRPFTAVHLRNLEGSCAHRMKRDYDLGRKVCNPTRTSTKRMMKRLLDQRKMDQLNWREIFVASDHQKKDAMLSYVEDTNYNDHMFHGKCKGYTCAIVEFEIAVRSSFFIGTLASTASQTISAMRDIRQTQNGIIYPSVMWFIPNELNMTIENYERHSCLV